MRVSERESEEGRARKEGGRARCVCERERVGERGRVYSC